MSEQPPHGPIHTELVDESTPRLDLSGETSLLINGELLKPEHGIDLFKRALDQGHDHILLAFERGLKQSQERFPGHTDIYPPPIDVMLIGNFPSKLNWPVNFFTEEAYFRGNNPYTDPDILVEEFRPFWQAVEEAGFRPQVWDRRHNNLQREIILQALDPTATEAAYGGITYDPE